MRRKQHSLFEGCYGVRALILQCSLRRWTCRVKPIRGEIVPLW